MLALALASSPGEQGVLVAERSSSGSIDAAARSAAIAESLPAAPSATSPQSSIVGRVVWNDGRAADDATLELRSRAEKDGAPRVARSTELKTADGGFVIDVEPGEYVIEAWAKRRTASNSVADRERGGAKEFVARWSSTAHSVTAPMREALTLTLEPGVPLPIVVRTEDGLIARRFKLHAHWAGAELVAVDRQERLFSVAKDAFTWRDLGPGRWEITATMTSSAPAVIQSVELARFIADPTLAAALELDVRAFASLRGRLVDAREQPLAHVDIGVRYATPRGWLTDFDPVATTTNEAGEFQLLKVVPDPLTLEVHSGSERRSVSETLELKPGEARAGLVLHFESK